ncbi:cytochrome P450 [Phycomyces nitens]|nr:cytochrome P450 [Phycomyces nitens]
MDIINTISLSLEPLVQRASDYLPKGSHVAMFLVLFLCKKIYDSISVPQELADFPSVSCFSFVKSFLSIESAEQRTRRLVLPLLNKKRGFYVARFPMRWTIFVTDPQAVQYLLMKGGKSTLQEFKLFPKDLQFLDRLRKDSLFLRLFGKKNVAFTSGDVWKHQRKIMNPAFRRTVPVDLFGRLIPDMFRLIDTSETDIQITTLLQKMSFDALGKALFGFDFNSMADKDSVWIQAYNDTLDGILSPIVNAALSYEHISRYIAPNYSKASIGINKLNQLIFELLHMRKEKIEQSMGQPDNGLEKDLLTLILEGEMKEKKELDLEELRSNMATFIVAGHETVSSSASFCIYHMAVNKDVQDKARQEALYILGDDDSMVPPTISDCKQINYINMIIKESLRLSSPASFLTERVTTEDVTLSGVYIPKGTCITVDLEALHKNPDVWKNPTVFDPERFRKGGEHDQHIGITWAPFSDGNRKCLGLNFSMAEQQVVLLMLLKHYEWELPEDSIHKNGIVYDGIFVFTPKTMNIRFRKRH